MNHNVKKLLPLLAMLVAIGAPLNAFTIQVQAKERIYYIAAQEINWQYAPSSKNLMMGRPLNDEEKVFTQTTDTLIGSLYKKVVFRQYSDASFVNQIERDKVDQHLGVLGPTIRAQVGDTIKVIFKNKASRKYSVHPHGVFYTKANEGVGYADGTSGKNKADDAIAPNETHTYIWQVPERAGPGPNDGSSIAWLYHSHVDEIKDTNSGLVGAIIITKKGMAKDNGSPKDIDREFITLFTVMNENQSWYLNQNIKTFTKSGTANVEGDDFVESNLMHTINGYLFANVQGLTMKRGEKVRWYQMALGTEVDIHSPHWHGNTGLYDKRRVDVVELMPATTKVVDMTPDSVGIWMFHCHVNDHLAAGMTALYTVLP